MPFYHVVINDHVFKQMAIRERERGRQTEETINLNGLNQRIFSSWNSPQQSQRTSPVGSKMKNPIRVGLCVHFILTEMM